MKRYRIYHEHLGRIGNFLAPRGKTLKELQAWKRRYNRYNKEKVLEIQEVNFPQVKLEKKFVKAFKRRIA